ncbi:MAG: hypothetical protein ACRC8Y_19205, partial [Chroococcales cyanobacterium]
MGISPHPEGWGYTDEARLRGLIWREKALLFCMADAFVMTHTIPKLDKKGLREFGLVTGAIFVGLFGLLIP